MELKPSTLILLSDFAIGSLSFFIDVSALPHFAKVAWLTVLVAGALLATLLIFKGEERPASTERTCRPAHIELEI